MRIFWKKYTNRHVPSPEPYLPFTDKNWLFLGEQDLKLERFVTTQ